jgi:acyl dehydratase
MTSGYFEDLEVGDTRKAGPYFVSKDEIIQFAKQFDPRPFHIDEEAAARSVFGGLSASAGHTFAIFIFLTDRYQPPFRALAGLGYDELRLPNAVRPGDNLYLESTTLEKRESKSKPDRGIVRGQSFLRNQKGDTVLQCVGSALVERRPDAKAST